MQRTSILILAAALIAATTTSGQSKDKKPFELTEFSIKTENSTNFATSGPALQNRK